MAAGDWAQAAGDLAEGLGIARRIGYPTLACQRADALSRALAARSERERGPDLAERAYEMARLAADTIRSVADRLADQTLAASFFSWDRVRAVHDDLDRLLRG